MKKNTVINQWLWKWHVIAGLLTLPVMLLLAVTGVIYLFKDDMNQYRYRDAMYVTPASTPKLSFEQQLQVANAYHHSAISSVILPRANSEATAFRLATKGKAQNYVYVDPYRGEVTGTFEQKQTLMFAVRKLHGELLLQKPGTIIVELVASWFVVLILTGLYVWWPKDGFNAKGLFGIRFCRGSRIMWRDLHAVLGFWLSVFLLIILAGGMPWTEVFGGQLKWLQQQTNSGYPTHWNSSKGLASSVDETAATRQRITLDHISTLPAVSALVGKITIQLPKGEKGVYSVSNRSRYLADQQVLHLDQYSGAIIKHHTWQDVGVLMDLRQVFMRLHQGEYGKANWYSVAIVALLFLVSTLASIISYLQRKPADQWAIPVAPARFQADKVLVGMIILLAIVFPMFGISVLLILLGSQLKKLSWREKESGH